MYVEVQYKRKGGEYSGQVYTYACAIPVNVGEIVLAPTARGDTPAKVVSVSIPYEEINPKYRDSLRTITRKEEPILMTPEEEEGFPLFEEA